MIAASVFVLSALTLTGVYMASIGDSGEDDNRIDFAQIEKQAQEQQPEVLPDEAGEHQKVGQQGEQGGEDHHRTDALEGARVVDCVHEMIYDIFVYDIE